MHQRQSDHDIAISEEQLNAFADGQLPSATAQQVARAIRRQPGHAEQIYDYWVSERALYQRMAGAFDRAPPISAPDPTLDMATPTWFGRSTFMAVAGVLITLFIGAQYVFFEGQQATSSPAQLAVNWFQSEPSEGIAPVEVDAQFGHLGLQPIGQQFVYFGGQPWLEIRFEDSEQTPIALYKSAFNDVGNGGWLRVFTAGQTPLAEWATDGNRFVLVGGSPSQDVAHLAVRMRAHLMASPAHLNADAIPEESSAPLSSEPRVNASGSMGMDPAAQVNGLPEPQFNHSQQPAPLPLQSDSPISDL